MRVVIDARWIQPEITGIGSYTQSLIRHLALLEDTTQYHLLFQTPTVRDRTLSHANIRKHPRFASHLLPFGPFSAKTQINVPPLLRQLSADVYHSPNFMIPFRGFPRHLKGSTACVVTIHDLIPLLHPEFTPKALKTRLHPLYRRLMQEVGYRADGIITVSESSRRDIINHMAIPADRQDRVKAIYEGVSQDYCPADIPQTRPPTILYVGRLDPYKNVPQLVSAFSRLIRRQGISARLKIIGPKDPRYPEVQELLCREGLETDVDWPGYVSGADLLQAYREATVFVLPSLYEGFGLPILEAMACGTPVICSNRASLPEVAGDAAVLLDPEDTDGLVRALTEVLTHAHVAQSMRIKGLHQAAQFSWENTAKETLSFYEQIVALT